MSKKRHPEFMYLPVGDLLVDPRKQQTLKVKKAQRIAEDLDPVAFGCLIVSRRADGKCFVVDGQHRLEAAKMDGYDKVPCLVWTGLKGKEEARGFVRCNQNRWNPPAVETFLVRLQYDPKAKAIMKVVEGAGYTIEAASGEPAGVVGCVNALERMYDADEGRSLEVVLGVIRKAYEDAPEALKSAMVRGVFEVVATFRDKIDLRRLVEALGRSPVDELRKKARSVVEVWECSLGTAISVAVVKAYNKGLGADRSLDERELAMLRRG